MDIDISQPIFGSPVLEWLSQYGYFILLPLLMFEGRVVGLIAAALAHLGYLNLVLVWALAVIAGTLSDTFYYFLGRSGHGLLTKFSWTRRLVDRASRHYTVSSAAAFLRTHGFKTFFFTKSVPSVSWPLQIAAGASRLDVRKYYLACFSANLIWSTVIMGLGYGMGYLSQNINIYIFIAIAILLLASFFVLGWKYANRISREANYE